MAALVYYIATSLDGFIAREDGDFSEFPWDDEFGADLMATYPETFPAHLRPGPVDASGNRRFGTVVMGRTTYQVGLDAGLTSPYPTLRQVVYSSALGRSPDPDVRVFAGDPAEDVAVLKDSSEADIWICGGSRLATSLFEAGLVDELIVKLNPIVFGRGLPLLDRPLRSIALQPMEARHFASGHARLAYRVG